MFDLTEEIILEPKWQRRYRYARSFLYLAFILGAFLLAYRILFPAQNFSADFSNPSSRTDSTTVGYEKSSPDGSILDAYSSESFSAADVQITAGQNAASLAGQKIMARKTYKAFAYPLADQPAAFPDGSLVTNNGQYFLVSGNLLRRFASADVLAKLGLSPDNFLSATAQELGYSPAGPDIADTGSFPDSSLFLIDGNYYQLKDQTLWPFVSAKAYLTRYDKNQALAEDKSFLVRYPVSQNNIGFADGTLLSFDIGVFLVANGQIMPFNNPITFLALGYNFKDVIPASEAEIGLYQHAKIFAINLPHPAGTIFFAQDSGKYYLIGDRQKQEIKGADILHAYLKRGPIVITEKSLEFNSQVSCQLGKVFLAAGTYGCSVPVAQISQSPGNDYEFAFKSPAPVTVTTAGITFSRALNWSNARNVLSIIKQKFLNNYGYQNQ